MLARILRLALVVAIIVAVAVLLFYAFLAALIVVPILALLFFLFGRKIGTRMGTVWVVGQPPSDRPRHDGATRPGPPPPVIEHDPNDLPEIKL